jgi:hypothetical protein
MGGLGSGALPTSAKPFAEDLPRLDVRDLRVDSDLWPVRVDGKLAGTAAPVRIDEGRINVCGQPLAMSTWPSAVGGPRLFVLCACGHRARVLFIDDRRLGCRRCLVVRWRSQHRRPAERAAARVDRAWRDLATPHAGWRQPPPGRHRRRHARLADAFERAHHEWRDLRKAEALGLVEQWERLKAHR